MEITNLALLGFFVESTVQYYSKLFTITDNGKWSCDYKMLSALGLGIGVAVLFNADVFSFIGIISPYPFVGAFMTGLIIARGSNAVHDLIEYFNAGKNMKRAEAESVEINNQILKTDVLPILESKVAALVTEDPLEAQLQDLLNKYKKQ